METENKLKMYGVISFNKSESVIRIVQLTLCQFGKYFSKDVINFLSQQQTLPLPKNGKIGKVTIVRMKINSTDCLVVELFRSSFTNRFVGGNFKVRTKYFKRLVETTDDGIETVNPIELVVDEQPILNIPKPKPPSEKTDTVSTTKRKSTQTKVIPFPNYYVFNYDYSMVIRFNRKNNSNYFYLSDVG